MAVINVAVTTEICWVFLSGIVACRFFSDNLSLFLRRIFQEVCFLIWKVDMLNACDILKILIQNGTPYVGNLADKKYSLAESLI